VSGVHLDGHGAVDNGHGTVTTQEEPSSAERTRERPPSDLPRRESSRPAGDTNLATQNVQSRRRQAALLFQRLQAENRTTEAESARPRRQRAEEDPEMRIERLGEPESAMELVPLDAVGRLDPAYAEMIEDHLQAQAPERRALLAKGASWKMDGPGFAAVVGKGLNLGVIASLGFNGWNVSAQTYIAERMRQDLPVDWEPWRRDSVAFTVAFLGASFMAGLGALISSTVFAPTSVGLLQGMTGAWELKGQDPELLYQEPRGYIGPDSLRTKPIGQYASELVEAVTGRRDAVGQQRTFRLDSLKSVVTIVIGFWAGHDTRIALAGLEQGWLGEGGQAAVSALAGAGLGAAFLAAWEYYSHVKVSEGGTAHKARVSQVVKAASDESWKVASKLSRTWEAFFDGREGGEAVLHVVKQWLLLSGAVHAATLATPLIQSGAAVVAKNAPYGAKLVEKMESTDLGYAVALVVLLWLFPWIGDARIRPKAPPADWRLARPVLGEGSDAGDTEEPATQTQPAGQ
jgi:hypothetical protein